MLDPAHIKFMAVETRKQECHGCLFEHERSEVCTEVERQAKLRDIPWCEVKSPGGRNVVYVLVPVDPRQQSIFDALPLAVGDEAEPKLAPNL